MNIGSFRSIVENDSFINANEIRQMTDKELLSARLNDLFDSLDLIELTIKILQTKYEACVSAPDNIPDIIPDDWTVEDFLAVT